MSAKTSNFFIALKSRERGMATVLSTEDTSEGNQRRSCEEIKLIYASVLGKGARRCCYCPFPWKQWHSCWEKFSEVPPP